MVGQQFVKDFVKVFWYFLEHPCMAPNVHFMYFVS